LKLVKVKHAILKLAKRIHNSLLALLTLGHSFYLLPKIILALLRLE
jgi:hypothetical protein